MQRSVRRIKRICTLTLRRQDRRITLSSTDSDAFLLYSAHYVDDDFQRRLGQILMDVKGLEDLINDIQKPKKTSENEVNEKIKV